MKRFQRESGDPARAAVALLKFYRNDLCGFLRSLLRRQAEGAAVEQLHDGDGEALLSGLVTEAELHLRAARRQSVLLRAVEQFCRQAGPEGKPGVRGRGRTDAEQLKL